MNKIIYLEGSRAVGKSTLLKNIKSKYPEFVIIDGSARKEYSFNHSILNEYIINEKLYLACNIAQYKVVKELDTTIIIVKGPYTDAFYAKRFGEMQFGASFLENNDLINYIEEALNCSPDLIVYLDAAKETIMQRYLNDTKKRSSMKVFMEEWLSFFESFYKSMKETVILDTDNKSPEKVLEEFINLIKSV